MCRQLKLISPISFTIGSVLHGTSPGRKSSGPGNFIADRYRELAQIPLTTGLLIHKISKPQLFSDFEYLSGNETLFPSNKWVVVFVIVDVVYRGKTWSKIVVG